MDSLTLVTVSRLRDSDSSAAGVGAEEVEHDVRPIRPRCCPTPKKRIVIKAHIILGFLALPSSLPTDVVNQHDCGAGSPGEIPKRQYLFIGVGIRVLILNPVGFHEGVYDYHVILTTLYRVNQRRDQLLPP